MLFCITPVTFVLITDCILTEPDPVPEFVTVPVLLMVPWIRTPLAVELLLLNVIFPVPLIAEDTVKPAVPRAFIKVVPPEFTVIAFVEIVRADVVEF